MKLNITQKNATAFYALIQALYYVLIASVACHASALLLSKGLTNGQIGTTLGISNILSVIVQPLIALFVQKTHVRLGHCLSALFGCMAILSVILLLFPNSVPVTVVTFAMLFMLQSATQSSINSLHQGYHTQGVPIHFSTARACGSAAFSISSLFLGQLVSRYTPSVLPILYLIPSLLLVFAILLFRAPNVQAAPSQDKTEKAHAVPIKRYPHFYLFLAGLICLASSHCFMETYFLQIIQRIGGTSANLGVAFFIAAIVELPAMLLYKKLYKQVGNRLLLCIAGWMWVTKHLLIILAPNIYVIYAAELLQFASYAIYVPAAVRYISHAIPQESFLKGQALAGSAFTIGGLLSSFGGGHMIDLLGMNPALWIILCLSFIGVILFTVTMFDSKRRFPTEDDPI